MSRSISAGSSPGGQSQVGDQPTVRPAGPGAHQQPDARIGRGARQLAQRQRECVRVVGLVERIHHDRERLRPLQQPVDQAVEIGLRCPGRGGQRAHDLVGRGGAGVHRDVDSAGSSPATGSPGASGAGMPARYRGSDMVTSRASTADFPDPGPPVTTRTLSAGSGAAVSQATSCDSARRRPVKNQPGRAARSTPRPRGSQCSVSASSPVSRDRRWAAADSGGRTGSAPGSATPSRCHHCTPSAAERRR